MHGCIVKKLKRQKASNHAGWRTKTGKNAGVKSVKSAIDTFLILTDCSFLGAFSDYKKLNDIEESDIFHSVVLRAPQPRSNQSITNLPTPLRPSTQENAGQSVGNRKQRLPSNLDPDTTNT